jgi:hypothetical protein
MPAKATNRHHAKKQTKPYPGAFALYKPSKEAVMRSLSSLILTFVINIGASLIINIIVFTILGVAYFNEPSTINISSNSGAQIGSSVTYSLANNLANVANLIVSTLTSAMFAIILLSAVRGKVVEIKDAFAFAKKNFIRFLLAHILVGLAVMGGFLLLIIPGFIFAVRLSLIDYVLVDNEDIDGMEAFRRAWRLTAGHSGKVWGIVGTAFLMVLPVFTLIGIPISIFLLVMYAGAMPLLYNYLVGAPDAQSNIMAPPPASAFEAKQGS